ncbi:MAG: SMI1/KNR4 family protein [Akkermansiaceae bacterium]|nr:SMI1/KNR4 family protein [Akkermansiaceae bacterium]MCP5551695.1 SMI1/KNR4 family protein [Akkermansiaceae bacterium]
MSDAAAEIEKIVGAKLPEDIKSFYSGAYSEIDLPAEIDVPDSSPWIDEVNGFYDADDALALLREDIRSLEYDTRQIPARTIPIADNGNGDFYIVSLREADLGAILYAFHETCDPMDDSLDGAIFLAPSFSEWTASFRPKQKRTATPDWDAIREAELHEILHPKPPWWKFWAKRNT